MTHAAEVTHLDNMIYGAELRTHVPRTCWVGADMTAQLSELGATDLGA